MKKPLITLPFTPLLIILVLSLLFGCGGPQIKLFSDASDPLQEYTITGEGQDKVLVISIHGVISTNPKEGFLRSMPSMVQETVAQLEKAEKDKHIKALLIKVDSPGGAVTAGDMLYHEIVAFKEKTGVKVVVAMMGTAASGGYYVSLPADTIIAHPTTVTGSVGVIIMRPDISGLMEKIGVKMIVNKSGKNKDMGSPFRPGTAEEQELLKRVTDDLANRFLTLVQKHRGIDEAALAEVATAKIYLAKDAERLGLVDRIGYLDDALEEARTLAGLPENATVIAYRRTKFPDDNLYNSATSHYGGKEGVALIDTGLPGSSAAALTPGFYYLWTPGLGM
ncbi:MAG: signal peptide peptidase SppA [Deltaproteobacteria bacterium]|nr:signal peptide peptidase SppA [Deltaproteobacteria bacterium]